MKRARYAARVVLCLLLVALLWVAELPLQAASVSQEETSFEIKAIDKVSEADDPASFESVATEKIRKKIGTSPVILLGRDAQDPSYAQSTGNVGDARNRLGSTGKALYDALLPIFAQIASGARAEAAISFTREQLQTMGAVNRYSMNSYSENQVWDTFYREMELDLVFQAVLHDCPYELYWFDKTEGLMYRASVGENTQERYYYISSLTLIYQVAKSYQGMNYPAVNEDNPSTSRYTVNTAKVAANEDIPQRAAQIVEGGEGLSDYLRLRYYADTICELTSYNFAVAEAVDESVYGDPFQMTYVFDDDPTTEVVCEGYAKAFQYLCNLTEFADSEVACYTVMGAMDGGAHMWNVVTLGNGENYLVDVTNSDEDTAGDGGELFLAGATGSATSGYTVRISANKSLNYQYGSYSRTLWGDDGESPLTLSNQQYAPSEIFIYVPTLYYDGDTPVVGLSGGAADIQCSMENGSDGNGDYRWQYAWSIDEYGSAPIDDPVDAGTYWLYIRATGFTVKEKIAKVVIHPAILTVTDISLPSKTYDGTNTVTASSMGVGGVLSGEEVLVEDIHCELPDAGVGEYPYVTLRSVTLTGDDAKNYRLETPTRISCTVQVLPKSIRANLTLVTAELEYNGESRLPDIRLMDGERLIDPAEYIVLAENNLGAGQATLRIVDREGGNYELEEIWGQFTITKRVPSYTLPQELTAVVGQTLGEIALPEGFAWQDSLDTVLFELGTQVLLARYTPADTANEQTLTDLEVTLRVTAPMGTDDGISLASPEPFSALYYFIILGVIGAILLSIVVAVIFACKKKK